MKARVTVEYDIPNGDLTALREREEQRWIRARRCLSFARRW